ncbi:hypothetical protein tpqmel_0891 [Candidatus Gastranaerophilus sp. (ex Termes propinquus)]|nr:hypothetical protein tpqmel_0891 [Candidatus Gastranaerophilus sp. (ex Termes propinquus)]
MKILSVPIKLNTAYTTSASRPKREESFKGGNSTAVGNVHCATFGSGNNGVLHSLFLPAFISEEESSSLKKEALYKLTGAKSTAEEFMGKTMQQDYEGQKSKAQNMVKTFGLENFEEWLVSPEGYFGAYEAYVNDLHARAESIDELLKFAPNWGAWKLKDKGKKLGQAHFTIGERPEVFNGKDHAYNEIVGRIKGGNDHHFSCHNFKVDKLEGPGLTGKFIFLVDSGDKKMIFKADHLNIEDHCGLHWEKDRIRSHKHQAADSIYTNACVSRYLELNGCENIAKLFYYDSEKNISIHEYIDAEKEPEGEEKSWGPSNNSDAFYENFNKLGIFFNDLAPGNALVDKKDGKKKVIDFGHTNFVSVFHPGARGFQVDIANACGPSNAAIKAALYDVAKEPIFGAGMQRVDITYRRDAYAGV